MQQVGLSKLASTDCQTERFCYKAQSCVAVESTVITSSARRALLYKLGAEGIADLLCMSAESLNTDLLKQHLCLSHMDSGWHWLRNLKAPVKYCDDSC